MNIVLPIIFKKRFLI